MISFEKDPITNIVELDSRDLHGNHWNPNIVMGKELELIERSILRNGWIQPIIINNNKIIIDGFHRWRISMDSAKIREKYNYKVPCAILDIPDDKCMLLTIQMNRAKGTHIACKMSDIVKSLINDYGYDKQQIAVELGAHISEVEVLAADNLFSGRNISRYKYRKSWNPR